MSDLTRDDVSFLSLMNVVLRHRRGIVRTTTLCVVVALVIGLVQDRTYTSTAYFVPQAAKGPNGLSGLAAQFGVAVPGSDAAQSPAFYVSLLTSRDVLEAIVDSRWSLTADTSAKTASLLDIYGIDASSPVLRRERGIARLDEDIAAATDAKTGMVKLAVSAPDPVLAQRLNRRLLALLNEFNLERRQSQAGQERRFTEERLGQTRGELRAAEDRLQSFMQGNRDYRNSPSLSLQYERLQRDVAMRQQMYGNLAQAYEQSRIDEIRDTPVITVIEQPRVPVRPNSRNLLLKLALAVIVGLGIGVFVAFLRERIDRPRFASNEEADEFAMLRREAIADLRRPWRSLGRDARRPTGPRGVSTDAAA
jgi:uncharacterized protein involved in exopolysaccharide biosynthesis